MGAAKVIATAGFETAAADRPLRLSSLSSLAFYLTTFLGAFLLFQVEPMLVKYLLPWFGGTSAVWTTSLLFFQLVLLFGYSYAHIVGTRLTPRGQVRLHVSLIFLSLLLMGATALCWRSPITPDMSWKPTDPTTPVLRLLLLLSVSIGLPYFVLSTTAPLLQAWFARSFRDTPPYRLYSLSNLGSLLALLSYPIAVEPMLTLRSQAWVWSGLYGIFGVGLALCARSLTRIAIDERERAVVVPATEIAGPPPTLGVRALWISLAACASLALLATTSQLTQDVAPIPLLWILPLAVYLLSFIICFESAGWYNRRWFHPALGLAIILGANMLGNPYEGIVRQVGIYTFLLFCVCMVCHGELVRLKPRAEQLTAFYLMIAIGGVIGGLFAAIVAPLIFRGYWEFELSIWGSALLLAVVLIRDRESWLHQKKPPLALLIFTAAMLLPLIARAVPMPSQRFYTMMVLPAVVLMAFAVFRPSGAGFSRRAGALTQFALLLSLLSLGEVLLARIKTDVGGSHSSRNFYGTLVIFEHGTSSSPWHYYAMRNGHVIHGRQYTQADKRREPTAYYGSGSGAGLILLHSRRPTAAASIGKPLRIGVVGLGVGTIAAYGRQGDYVRYYEINPDVIKEATDPHGYFTFVRDSPARVEIVPGDARLVMEREVAGHHAQAFDVLTVDAFSGDSVPVHLLTVEAVALYLQELRPEGVIAFHITNGYVDLRPVLAMIAQDLNLHGGWLRNRVTSQMEDSSDWVLLTRNPNLLASPDIAPLLRTLEVNPKVGLWTDDYSNLFQILK